VNLNEIATKILASPDGGTVRMSARDIPLPESGYFVGHGHRGLVCPVDMASRAVVLGALVHLYPDTRFIGWWTDGGRFYIEPSDWLASETEALALARERGELAFFDIASQADVRLTA